MSMHLFTIYVIFCLYYGFLSNITSLACGWVVINVNVLAFLSHVFKLMSLILVKLNCPVRDNKSFLARLFSQSQNFD